MAQVDELDNAVELLNGRAASDMLEDAIHHFDNIIDGKQSDIEDEESNLEFDTGVQGVALLMEDLRNAVEATLDLELNDDKERSALSEALLRQISQDTLTFYRKLLGLQFLANESEPDKIKRLVTENESLSLQVSVMSDQIELQTEKLADLEAELKEASQRLDGADARLREEVIAKTSLETQKLELMNEMANFRINLVQQEQQKKQEDNDLVELEKRNLDSEARNDQYRFVVSKLNKMKQKVVQVQREKLDCSAEIELLQESITKLEKESQEKDQLIQDLWTQIKILKANAVPNVTSPDEGIVRDHDEKEQRLLQLRMPAPYATSTPISVEAESKKSSHALAGMDHVDGAVAPKSINPVQSNVRSQSLEKLHSARLQQDLIKSSSQEDSLADHHGNLGQNLSGSSGILSDASSPAKLAKSPPKSKSSSTPNLAMTEVRRPESAPSTPARAPPSNQSPFHQRKKHGFRKFFSSFRLRRTRSTSLEPGPSAPPVAAPEQEEDHFRRGGVRSTAGPRLGWNPRDIANKTQASGDVTPFGRWSPERVGQWMTDIGLYAYVDACKKWVRSGDTLLRATNHELEKELGIRNPIHKKKLMLHLQAQGEDEEDTGAAHMSNAFVARWLDDIGLPQYKDAFHEACVDGRVLHHLTVSDAHKLRVSNLFHLYSLRRAIEVLRGCQFDPTKLRRRPLGEGESEEVRLWTNHRVMEWLRTVDLAEYAPNLRGSGVHGAVLVLEPLFTAETLASLLHIPNSKSLLRRHLEAKLTELLPPESAEAKEQRSHENGYQPINITVKYKIGRRSFGGLGKFRGSSAANAAREFGSGEYVCPIASSSQTMENHRSALERKIQTQSVRDRRNVDDVEPDDVSGSGSENIEVVELNESATREINAFSTQLNSLTSNWKEL